jgi:uncharacterized phage-associated protein
MTAISVFDAARHICEFGGWKISNLGLQKILYLSQMAYMGETGGHRLADTDFEAWDYGPVAPELYQSVKIFGAKPISNIFFTAKPVADGGRLRALNAACKYLVGKKPSELVAITHWDQGAWAKNYVPGVRGVPIPDGDIVDEYRKRLTHAADRASPGVATS